MSQPNFEPVTSLFFKTILIHTNMAFVREPVRTTPSSEFNQTPKRKENHEPPFTCARSAAPAARLPTMNYPHRT